MGKVTCPTVAGSVCQFIYTGKHDGIEYLSLDILGGMAL